MGAVMAIGLAGSALAKDYKSITIATEGAYEPWNFVQPDGKLAGFEVDLAADLCKRMTVQCTVSQQDWDGMIPGLNAGKFDVIMAGMSITPQRLEAINFSVSYGTSPNGFMVPKSSPLAALPGTDTVLDMSDEAKAKVVIDKMRDLVKGKTIGVQVATIHANFLDKYFKDIATIQEYKTAEEMQLDLTAGRIDAAFAEDAYFLTTLSKPEGKDLMLAGAEFRGGPIFGQGVAAGLRKADPDLKAMFDKAIASAKADGTLKTLQDKWFKLDMMPPA